MIDSSTKLELENNMRDSESDGSDNELGDKNKKSEKDKNAIVEIPKVKE